MYIFFFCGPWVHPLAVSTFFVFDSWVHPWLFLTFFHISKQPTATTQRKNNKTRTQGLKQRPADAQVAIPGITQCDF